LFNLDVELFNGALYNAVIKASNELCRRLFKITTDAEGNATATLSRLVSILHYIFDNDSLVENGFVPVTPLKRNFSFMFDGKHNSQQTSTACAIADLSLFQEKKLSVPQPYPLGLFPAAESRAFYESNVVSTIYQQLLASQSPSVLTITSIEEIGLIIKESNLFRYDYSDVNLRVASWG